MALTDNGNGLSAADVAAFNTSQVAQTAQLEAFIRANQTTPATTAG